MNNLQNVFVLNIFFLLLNNFSTEFFRLSVHPLEYMLTLNHILMDICIHIELLRVTFFLDIIYNNIIKLGLIHEPFIN